VEKIAFISPILTHVAGESFVTLTLSSPLDATDDLLVDELSAAATTGNQC